MNSLKISRDLGRIREIQNDLHNHQGKNYKVLVPDYLNPEINKNHVLPMNHSEGSFMYLEKIAGVLKKALEHKYVSKRELPINSPKYLEELAR